MKGLLQAIYTIRTIVYGYIQIRQGSNNINIGYSRNEYTGLKGINIQY